MRVRPFREDVLGVSQGKQTTEIVTRGWNLSSVHLGYLGVLERLLSRRMCIQYLAIQAARQQIFGESARKCHSSSLGHLRFVYLRWYPSV